MPSWEVLHADGSATTAGTKRSHDYGVGDFLTDVKKRRVNPSYDPCEWKYSCLIFCVPTPQLAMIDRLENLVYQSTPTAGAFNPRQVSLDIRTEEELAAVNQFLVALGRDVSSGGAAQPLGSMPNSYSPQHYFDASALEDLGLAGMPGMSPSFPSDSSGYSSASVASQQYNQHGYGPMAPLPRSSHPSVQSSQYGPVYSALPESNVYGHSRRSSSISTNQGYAGNLSQYPSPPQHQQIHLQPTPPLDASSPHHMGMLSPVSTPSSSVSTPPHLHSAAVMQPSLVHQQSHPIVNLGTDDGFGQLRTPLRQAQAPRLGPPTYTHPTQRTILSLGSSPAAKVTNKEERPEPVEPKIRRPYLHPGPPARLNTEAGSIGISHKIYPSLADIDEDYKDNTLPPIKGSYRSPSPDASPRSQGSRETTPTPSSGGESPAMKATVLPGFRTIAAAVDGDDGENLASNLGSIQLARPSETASASQRTRHAELIRDLLVAINDDFKNRRRYSKRTRLSESPRLSPDVEMTA
jgi:hypothetical protein